MFKVTSRLIISNTHRLSVNYPSTLTKCGKSFTRVSNNQPPKYKLFSRISELCTAHCRWKTLKFMGGFVVLIGGSIQLAMCSGKECSLSLSAWHVVKDGVNEWIERIDNSSERYRCPDSNNLVQDVPHPPFITQDNWTQLRTHIQWKPTDIIVATFPKCGTTFTEQVVLLLLNGGDPTLLSSETQNAYNKETGSGKVWVEGMVEVTDKPEDPGAQSMSLEEFNALPEPRLIKTHAPRSMFLCTDKSGKILPGIKVIYVTRNARDACVSSFYHAHNPYKSGWPFDAWVKCWVSGCFEHGTWFDHVKNWWKEACTNKQVLWVHYEDMVAHPKEEITRIARFLDIKLNDYKLTKVIEHSRFDKMKARSKNHWMFRKGKIGDHRAHFKGKLAEEFEQIYAKEMRGVNIKYDD